MYVVALFMTVIDGTMVNVALPTLAEQWHVDPADAEFIAVGYLLGVASVIPAAGWLGDRFGTKRIFMIALTMFVATSMLCGFAQSLDQLVWFRVVQGFGGGLITPIGSTIMFRAFPLSQRATAATAVLSVAVVAPAAGPVLGGLLVDSASWRWIFLINLPIGLVGWTLAAIALREERQPRPGRFDLVGLVLSGGSIAALLYALTLGPEDGWLSPTVMSIATAGAVGMVLLVVVELRLDEPMLALRLLRDGLFRNVNIASSMLYAGFFGFMFVLPVYLQTARGHSAALSGLVQSPQAIAILLVSNTVGKAAYHRIGPRRLMFVGGLGAAGATVAFATFDLGTPLWLVAAMSFCRGFAIGFVFISIQTSVYATTSLADTGRAASLYNTQRQVSYASGVAIAATVLAAFTPDQVNVLADDRLPAIRYAFVALGLLMIPSALWALRIDDDAVAATRQAGSSTPTEPAIR